MKITITLKNFLTLLVLLCSSINVLVAQCPIVTIPHQSFCDLQSPTIADLVANDSGNGVVWYSSNSSTNPLASGLLLIHGTTYFVDDNSGVCGDRQSVYVTVYTAPTGPSFQTPCVENATEATIGVHLALIGNNIQWYAVPEGGLPLLPTDQVTDNTIYYASQTNPITGCETSRKAVYVEEVVIISPPQGDPIQYFCNDPANMPTLQDMIVVAPGVRWYSSMTSMVYLPMSTPLVDGVTYYAASVNEPCISTSRLAVTVEFMQMNQVGGSNSLSICDYDLTPGNTSLNLFDSLIGLSSPTGVWTGDVALANGHLGTIDLLSLVKDVVYTFTYTVTDSVVCPEAIATISIIITTSNDPGLSGNTPPICPFSNDDYDLFEYLVGNPDVEGEWFPSLASGTGVFNPSLDSFGVYTYMFNDGCSDTASVTVIEQITYNPGEDNTTPPICPASTDDVDLFSFLEGNPDTGGFWTPTLSSGTSIFNPVNDNFGVYTYSFNDGCTIDVAMITVVEQLVYNPGEDGATIPPICPEASEPVDLFMYLEGTPDIGGFWEPSLASGTGFFNPAVDAFGVYTYTFNDGCSDTATVTVLEEITYNPGIGGSTEPICPNSNALVDLFTYLTGNPDVGGIWTPALASGTGVFNPAVDDFGDYVYMFDDGCTVDTATVTVIAQPIYNPGQDGDTPPICPSSTDDVDLFGYLNGTPDVGGEWVPALASGTGIFNAANDSFGVYTYMFNDNCTTDSATVTVVMEDTLDPGIGNVITICPEETNVIDLFDILGGTPDVGGVWVPSLTSGTGIFDPLQDTFGVYTYTFNNGCSLESTTTVELGVVHNPGTDGNTPPICPASTDDVDLFSYLSGNPDVGGIWVPALASGTGIFNASNDAFGIYTYMFDDGCTVDIATVTVVMENTPNPGISDSVTICPGETNTTIDLFEALGETADIGGVWIPSLTSGTGIFNPIQDTFGIYTYTFNNGCSLDATIEVIAGIINNPGISGSTPPICPASTEIIDLFGYLTGNPDVGGEWVPTLSSGTGAFNPAVDSFGIYTYMFNDGCTTDIATVTVVMENTPNPGISNSIVICPGETNTIDLFEVLGETADVGGFWIPALESGTGIFNAANDSFGTYTYTFNNGCSLDATITVIEGDIQNSGTNGITPPICPVSTDDIDLFDYLTGTPDIGGIWIPALTSGTGIFNPAMDSFGVYTYMFTDGCSNGTATVTVVMENTPNPGISDSVTICPGDTATVDLFVLLGNTADSGGFWIPALESGTGIFNATNDNFGIYTYTFNNGCSLDATITVIAGAVQNPGEDGDTPPICPASTDDFDLFGYLNGTPDVGGEWVPALASGTGIFNAANDSFGVYTYMFNDGCTVDTATVTVVMEDTPSPGISNTITICPGDTNTIDLFGALGGTADIGGFWVPALTSGTGIFDPTDDNFGVYTYTFNNGCSLDATITVIEGIVHNPGISEEVPPICPNDTNLIDLFAYLGGTPDTGGEWVPALSSGTGIFNPVVDSFGVYTYMFTDDCSSDTATITVTLKDTFDPGDSNTLPPICPDDIDLIDLFSYLGGTPDVGGVWVPALTSGTGIFDPTVDNFGVYTYTFNDDCSLEATIEVIQGVVLNPGDSRIIPPICSNNTSLIDLFTYLEGTPDVGGVWVPTLASGTGVFNPVVDSFGVYTYMFNDNCSLDTATITITSQPTFESGTSNSYAFCPKETPTVDLFTLLGGTPDVGGVWVPTLASGTGVFDLLVDSFGDYTYTFNDDCSDSATITVIEDCGIVIPDGFSPNQDGINDFFEIKNLRDLYPNFKIEIYNRYGNSLFKGDASKPDWDGTSSDSMFGEGAVPVGVYFFILEFNDGEKKPLQGRLYLSR